MTAQSIGAGDAVEYARYLESKTIAPELGDYYLAPGGEPTQAPGQWLSSPDTLAMLGIEGATIEGRDFVALMEGKHPRSGGWLRRQGAGGGRAGGIDITLSPPKSVSTVWALGEESQRVDMEAAHAAAVSEAIRAPHRDGAGRPPALWRASRGGASSRTARRRCSSPERTCTRSGTTPRRAFRSPRMSSHGCSARPAGHGRSVPWRIASRSA
ncbi:MAG TPA: relaxase domain-containing protein [Solirubrobacteraceae bacterium]